MSYDPTFSTRLTDAGRNNIIYAESLNVFPDPVLNVIILSNLVHYRITQPLNVGLNKFEIPDEGTVQFSTTNAVANVLSTDITGTDVFFSGDIRRFEMAFTNNVSNSGEGVFWEFNKGAVRVGS